MTAARPPARALSVPRWLWASTFVLGVAVLAMAALPRGDVPTHRPAVLQTYPHDANAFCQGLVIDGGELYEGTGQYGASSLRQVDLATGRVERSLPLDRSYFGEGITLVGDEIVQLTWRNRIGFVYDRRTFELRRTFRYTGEGWGVAYDGTHLIVSDGTSTLRFLDPQTYDVVRKVVVRAGRGAVSELNELEYVEGEILANVWHTDKIVRIAPKTGEVLGWLDLTGILPARQRPDREAVLNGIAYDAAEKRLFVTGKHWPKLFEIDWPPKPR